ncbi:Anhydro-N-acetylmuramic acid kinase [Geitlerinema sp. FC II]|nr:anhydro-N-acetylmuramic acid kinase [Geitlerinema sp. CS-897]PPT05520.1 Anhydro-N-acetylmuramic acid kinase [Geitlerinema sp. FC II]
MTDERSEIQENIIAKDASPVRAIGAISGTSVDGIDAVLVELTGTDVDLQVKVLAAKTYPYPEDLRSHILDVCSGGEISMAALAELDEAIAKAFANAAIDLQKNHPPARIIGSHGQTVFHRPPRDGELGYSLQLGRGATLAALTGIPTVSNFRAADIEVGGQGAPLVSKLDLCLFGRRDRDRCVQNLGGIGNVTYLPAGCLRQFDRVRGWDTGPGNVLLDLAVSDLTDGAQTFDRDGAWAASGHPDFTLVERWLQDDFFRQPPPKSTGREHFGREFLHRCRLEAEALNDADWLATLTELTVSAIVDNYSRFLPRLPDDLFLCGGGSRNRYLKQRLQARLENVTVKTTDDAGVNADYKEAIAFAVLAYWRGLNLPGNLPSVTGASRAVVLGERSLVALPEIP